MYPSASIPEVTSLRYHRGKLLWTDTESGRTHTDLLSIDGGPPRAVADGSASTAALAFGPHTASLTVRDAGGTISEAKKLAFTVRPAPTVSRITGSDRYGHAAATSRSAFATATTAVLVGSGSWPDAFSAAPLAHVVRGPVLPTSRTALPATTKTELARLRVKKIIIVGSTKDVSAALSRSLVKRGYSVSRVSGSDRYTTANAVAREIARRSGGKLPDGKVVVVGNSYSNALAASAVAARRGWPLLYSRLEERAPVDAGHAEVDSGHEHARSSAARPRSRRPRLGSSRAPRSASPARRPSPHGRPPPTPRTSRVSASTSPTAAPGRRLWASRQPLPTRAGWCFSRRHGSRPR